MANRARNTIDRTWDFMARIPSSVVLIVAMLGFLGTVVALIIVIPLSGKVADQARAGNRARARQIQVAPEGCALALDAYARRVISRRMLEKYAASAPVPCRIK